MKNRNQIPEMKESLYGIIQFLSIIEKNK